MAKIIIAKQEEVKFKDKRTGEDVTLYKLNVIKETAEGLRAKDYWVKEPVKKEFVANPFTEDFVVCEADFDLNEETEKVKISNIRPEQATK